MLDKACDIVFSSCWLNDDEIIESMGMLPATSSFKVDSSRLKVVPSSVNGGVDGAVVVAATVGVVDGGL